MILEFFLSLFALSLSGTLLGLLLFLLKQFYQNRFSRRWQYYIWILAVLRFIVPFSSDTALINVLFQTAQTAMIQNSADGSDRSDKSDQSVQSVQSDQSDGSRILSGTGHLQADAAHSCRQSRNKLPVPTADSAKANTIWDFKRFHTHLPEFLFLLWLLPALFLLSRKILSYQAFVHELKTSGTKIADPQADSLLAACKKTWNITKNITLYHAPWLSTPVLTGFFHPCIAIPDTQMPQTQLSFIFTHELIHYKRRDLYYKWLIQAVRCIHWFNPFLHLLEKEVNKACELSCDETVIHALGSRERKAYGDTLLLCARPRQTSGHSINQSVSSVMLTENAAQLKERLGAIMNDQKKTQKTIFSTAAATVCLCICFPLLGTYAAPAASTQALSPRQTDVPVRTASAQQSKFTKYRELLKLNTTSCRNMTVADFREHAAFVLDTREGMRLLEQALRDEQINFARFTDDDAFFIRNTLLPLTDGDWKSDFITAAGVERPLKNGMLAELEFRAGIRIRNTAMKVSEYEDAYRRLADTALSFLNKKTDSELSDGSGKSTKQIEQEAMQKLRNLADDINKTANLTLTIQTCIYAPENGVAASKIATSKNIPSDAKKVLTLKTNGYKDLTAEEFGNYVSERYEADKELWKARQRFARLDWKELQKKLSRSDYLFLTVTLTCTESESTNPHDRVGNIPPDFGARYEEIAYPKHGTALSFEWTVRYEINKQKLTVRERDQRIVQIQSKMADFIENTPKNTDIGTMNYLRKMRRLLDRLVKEASSPEMKMTVFECRSDGKSA